VIGDLRELQRRRAALVERSSELRAGLVRDAAPILQKAASADRVICALRRYPIVTAVAAGVVAVVGTSSILPWLTRALTLYTLLKKRH
jgi:type II secretory pathway component PulF